MFLRFRLLRRFRMLRLTAVPLLIAVLAIAVACDDDTAGDGDDAAAGSGFPRVLQDADGVDVRFEAPPQRIISLSPGATEILFAIGAGDRVVATDEFSDFPAAAAALPKLTYTQPNPEAALAQEPDLVLMATQQAEQIPQFRDLGLPAFFLREPESVEGVYAQILLLGELTGQRTEAEALVADMRSRIEAVVAKLSDIDDGPRVFFELSADLYTVGPATFVGGMLELLHAKNIAAGAASAFPQLSTEALIDADPEVVLLADAEFEGGRPEDVAARPGWAGVSAVVNGRLYPIDPDLTNRPGPRIAEGIELLARALYPERFE